MPESSLQRSHKNSLEDARSLLRRLPEQMKSLCTKSAQTDFVFQMPNFITKFFLKQVC